MKNTKTFQFIRPLLLRLFIFLGLIITNCPLAHCQLFIADQAEFFVDTNGVLKVDGNVQIQLDGTLTMNGQEIMIAGDLIQNGNFNNPAGKLNFIGTGVQNVSGNLTGTNAPFDLVIEQGDNNSSVDFLADIEVENTLEFLVGKITTNANEVYLKNEAANAIIGHFVPNITDGTYASNDRFVEGVLARNVNPSISTTYIFPIGSSGDFYNPVQIENLSGNAGKISANFSSENLGPINFLGTVDCSANNPVYSGTASNVVQSNDADTDIEYSNMTSQGVWDISSATNFDYDLVAYPNAANVNANPSTTGQYHLLKRPSGDDPSSDWTPFALSGNPCINTTNYFELVGTGYSDFSIFGAVGVESAILPIELIYLHAQPIDNEYIKLKWATASEINNLGFEIERSLDGRVFEKIGWQDGSGDFENERNYDFDDKYVYKNQLYYYRLKQVDLDGKYEYSEVVIARILGDIRIDIYPNPTHDEITLHHSKDLQNESLSFEVYDILGRQVFYQNYFLKGQTSFHFSFQNSNLSKGIYYLKIRNSNREVTSETLVFN